MTTYRIIQTNDGFRVAISPSMNGSGGFLMGFTSEAEAKAALDEYLHRLEVTGPLTDGFTER